MITWGLAPPIRLLTFDIDFCPVVPCFRIDNIIVFYSIFRSNQRSLPFVIEADFALNAYESAENLNVFLLFRSRVQVVFLSRRGRRMKISRKKRGKYYLATNIFFKMTGSYKKIKCTSFHLKKKSLSPFYVALDYLFLIFLSALDSPVIHTSHLRWYALHIKSALFFSCQLFLVPQPH